MTDLYLSPEEYFRRAINDPQSAPVPRRRGDALRVAMTAASRVDSVTLPIFMQYLIRMKQTPQVLFAILLCGSDAHNKAQMAANSKAFVNWAVDNADQF
jgi:hypothetical protein